MVIATKAETALRGCNEQSSCLFSNVSFPFGLLVMGLLSCLESRMTRKMTKRKKWNLVDPIGHAMVGAAITPRHLLDKLRLTELAALESMTKGQGTVQDWRTLVDLLNLSEMMGRNGVGAEVLPVCEKAQEGLHKAAIRYQETLTMGLDGVTIKALRDLIEYADLQQGSIHRSVFEQFVEKTRNYIKGNGNRVVEIA
jgi:hypothetical protein